MYDDMPSEEDILKLQKKGHTFHCAMRILTGDGECECGLQGHIPGGLSRIMYRGRCPVCMQIEPDHEEWCKKPGLNSLGGSHNNDSSNQPAQQDD